MIDRKRRRFLQLLGALSAEQFLCAHSPYGQWMMYRKVRLIILTSRADEHNWRTGEALAQLLFTHLPTSKATYARARDFTDIVRLLNSKQHDMALIRDVDAQEGVQGSGRFAEDGATPLRVIARIGAYVLVTREDFENNHAYLIAQMIDHKWSELAEFVAPGQRAAPGDSAPAPVHLGAASYYADPQSPAPAQPATPANPLNPSDPLH